MVPRPHGVGRCSIEDLYLQVSGWWSCCRQRRGPGSVWWHLVHHIMPQSLTNVSAYRNQNVIHTLRAQLKLWVPSESEGGEKKEKKKKRLGWPRLELVQNSQSHKLYERFACFTSAHSLLNPWERMQCDRLSAEPGACSTLIPVWLMCYVVILWQISRINCYSSALFQQPW